MKYVFLIWVVTSIATLKIIAFFLRNGEIRQEKQTKRRLYKWVYGDFRPGERPSPDEKFYLREGLSMLADGGKLVKADVHYSFVTEFFPATSNFFHGAFDDMKYMLVVVPVIVGMILTSL